MLVGASAKDEVSSGHIPLRADPLTTQNVPGNPLLAFSLFALTPLLKRRHVKQKGLSSSEKPGHQTDSRSEEQVLSIISHEFRTPISVILGYVDTLRSELGEEYRGPLDAIVESSGQLMQTLNSVLEWIEVSECQTPVEPASFDVGKVLDEVVISSRNRAEKEGLRLVCIAPVGEIRMVSDSCRVRQILDYLLDNAFKFTPTGEIRLSVSPTDNQIQITISDTGVGFDTERLDELSRPFSQGSVGDTRNYGGLGLGLTLATEGARALGGKIKIEHRSEGGTRVEILLPRFLNGAISRAA